MLLFSGRSNNLSTEYEQQVPALLYDPLPTICYINYKCIKLLNSILLDTLQYLGHNEASDTKNDSIVYCSMAACFFHIKMFH